MGSVGVVRLSILGLHNILLRRSGRRFAARIRADRGRYDTGSRLKRTRSAGEGVVRIRADEPNRADYQYQDDGQHHCILGNVLPFVFSVARAQRVRSISYRKPLGYATSRTEDLHRCWSPIPDSSGLRRALVSRSLSR